MKPEMTKTPTWHQWGWDRRVYVMLRGREAAISLAPSETSPSRSLLLCSNHHHIRQLNIINLKPLAYT